MRLNNICRVAFWLPSALLNIALALSKGREDGIRRMETAFPFGTRQSLQGQDSRQVLHSFLEWLLRRLSENVQINVARRRSSAAQFRVCIELQKNDTVAPVPTTL